MNERDLNLLCWALEQHTRLGDREPLAAYLEADGELTAELKGFLAMIVRGKLKFPRGQQHKFAQAGREIRARHEIRSMQREEAALGGTRGSVRRAWDRYLSLHPEVSEEQLRSYFKRGGNVLSKKERASLDEMLSLLFDNLDELQRDNGVDPEKW